MRFASKILIWGVCILAYSSSRSCWTFLTSLQLGLFLRVLAGALLIEINNQIKYDLGAVNYKS